MFTIIIALLIGAGVYFLAGLYLATGWAVTCAIVTVLLVQLAIGLYIRRKVNQITANIQQIMEAAQNRINRKMQQMQQRPMSSIKSAQQILEKDQFDAIRQAIEATRQAEPYFHWNALLGKQINTMRMMLYFQMKDFKKVDELLPKSMFLDSRSAAVKAIRMYKKEDPKFDRFIAKKCKKFKGDDAVLLYSLYAWILVKQEKYELAASLLAEGKKRTDNPVITENWERLVNGKFKHFSNANLGEIWYSLYLEEPKIKQQRTAQRGF